MHIFIIAYWHDPRFKRKVGGLIRIFELADNLTQLGHQVYAYSSEDRFGVATVESGIFLKVQTYIEEKRTRLRQMFMSVASISP